MKWILLVLALLILGCTTQEIAEKPIIPEEKPEPVVKVVAEDGDMFKNNEGLHWGHMPISYSIVNENECGSYESRKIERAFNLIEEETNKTVRFAKVNENADVDVSCSFIEGCYEKKVDVRSEEGIVYRYETICAHNRGIAQINVVKGKQIMRASIEMIGLAGFSETSGEGMSGFFVGTCGHITTELHEILHVFGYGHFDDNSSIMYPSEDSVGYTIQNVGVCTHTLKDIDAWIIEDLIKSYSNK